MSSEDWKPSTPEERLFDTRFFALTYDKSRRAGQHPFRWQWRLFEHLARSDWPYQIDLPTGLGKTSVIALWVLALGRALERGSSPLLIPRRLAYVVDRRVVVDQASEEAEMIVARLEEALGATTSDALHSVALHLHQAGSDGGVLALSALRGQRTLDTNWRTDPARPAIIIGTVDMIGSRLLFSAYGRVGPWGRPYEAGLLAQDCLIVLDEAHLSQPFDDTLAALESHVAQRRMIRPFGAIRMGATSRPCPPGRSRFSLCECDREPRVLVRLAADKQVELVEPKESVASDLAQWAVEVALHESGHAEHPAIGLVVNTVRAARSAHAELRKTLRESSLEPDAVLVITGSMRGIERDEIVNKDSTTREALLYRRFRAGHDRNADGTAFLVATSCIEVGADIDLDHLGTEACPLDSLVQRLGRVNRRGERPASAPSTVRLLMAEADAPGVSANVSEWLRALQVSPERQPGLLLKDGALDGSPLGLPLLAAQDLDGSHEMRTKLCGAPEPVPVLSRAVIDDLSMTSLSWDEADRPDIGLWLHGCAPDDEGAYAEIGWRMELDRVDGEQEAASLIDAFPLSPRETARCPLRDAVKLLQRLRSQPGVDAGQCLVIVRGVAAEGYRIASLPEGEADAYRLAAWSQLVLPCSAGGYENHFVDPEALSTVEDVADRAIPETWARRQRLWIREGFIGTGAEPDSNDVEVEDIWLADDTDQLRAICEPAVRNLLGKEWDATAAAGSAERGVLVARRRRTRAIENADQDRASVGYGKPVSLSDHLDDAARWARVLCDRLHLDEHRAAITEAAQSHDLGKNRTWWQSAIGAAPPPPLPHAKSGRSGFDYTENAGYRHEFGSLLDLFLNGRTPADLVAHLVAGHHGHARPAFGIEAAGPGHGVGAGRVIAEVALRFARLHQDLGAWQLAYLEALVKAADALASQEVGA
jgi:CRISPR-associated endonuclease/helicase Cas3